MEIHSLIDAFQTVLREHTGMGYFVDLLLKSFFVLILMLVARPFTRRLPASMRHLVLTVGFFSLFILPLFIGFLPKIQVPIATDEVFIGDNTMTRGIVTIADSIPLVAGAWWKAFITVYFSLLAIQLSYIFLGLCKVWSLSQSAEAVVNPQLKRELENLALGEGLTVKVSLLKSRDVYSPISWGLFSPQIILPVQAENWGPEKIRNVLIHELSHIQRLDWLTSLVVRLARAVYWFNPLIWFAARELEEDAEQACDDAVILNGRCHSEYASNLLEIASCARNSILGHSLVQAIAGSFLGSRVFSILDTSRRRQNTEVVWVVRGLLIGGTAIAILASLRLVPLVNVTSIDPQANTAFSVIFIPKSEASTYTGYMNYQKEPKEQPNGWSRLRISHRILAANSARQTGKAGVMAKQAEKTESAASEPQKRPSLLEEFMSASGGNDSEVKLERYVREYTTGLIMNVEAGLDLGNFIAGVGTDEADEESARPVAIKKIFPQYPRIARQRGIEGYSVVEYAIDSAGRVKDPVIVDSSPGSVFNRSSLKAIQQYEFEPPTINGEVVGLEGLQTRFVYQLKPG